MAGRAAGCSWRRQNERKFERRGWQHERPNRFIWSARDTAYHPIGRLWRSAMMWLKHWDCDSNFAFGQHVIANVNYVIAQCTSNQSGVRFAKVGSTKYQRKNHDDRFLEKKNGHVETARKIFGFRGRLSWRFEKILKREHISGDQKVQVRFS